MAATLLGITHKGPVLIANKGAGWANTIIWVVDEEHHEALIEDINAGKWGPWYDLFPLEDEVAEALKADEVDRLEYLQARIAERSRQYADEAEADF